MSTDRINKNRTKSIITFINLIFSLILFLSSAGLAQIIKVKDQKTGEPVAFAQIKSEVPEASATTNEKGQADLSAFRGSAEITISRLGYVTLITSFAELERLNFEVAMMPTPLEVHEIVVSASRWQQTTREVPITNLYHLPF